MDDLSREFPAESSKRQDNVDARLVQFEREANNAGILDNAFRLVHRVKGTCGFLSLPWLEALTHVGEKLNDDPSVIRVTLNSSLQPVSRGRP